MIEKRRTDFDSVMCWHCVHAVPAPDIVGPDGELECECDSPQGLRGFIKLQTSPEVNARDQGRSDLVEAMKRGEYDCGYKNEWKTQQNTI